MPSESALSVWLPLVLGRVRAELAFLPSVTTEMANSLYGVCSCVNQSWEQRVWRHRVSVRKGALCVLGENSTSPTGQQKESLQAYFDSCTN